MKRAVSSMDASAQAAQRGSSSTQQYRLKRCKSAFANLKRLGGGGSAATVAAGALPTTRITASYADEAPANIAEDAAFIPRWRPYGPDVGSSSPPSSVGGPLFGSRWAPPDANNSSSSNSSSSSSSSSTTVPVHHSLSPQYHHAATERRLFGGKSPHTGGVGGGADQEGLHSPSSRVVGVSSRNAPFASRPFAFAAVPEQQGETAAAAAAGGRCPFLHHQLQQQHQHQQQQQQGSQQAAMAGGGGGFQVAAPSETGETCCWVDPESPGFSIVGFGDDEDEDERSGLEGEDEDGEDWSDSAEFVSSTPSPLDSPAAAVAAAGWTQAPAAGSRRRGINSCVQTEGLFGQNRGNISNSTMRCTSGDSSTAFSEACTSSTSRSASVPACAGGLDREQRPAGGGVGGGGVAAAGAGAAATSTATTATPAAVSEPPSSPLLLLRLQRRFEEMLLVSNVAI